MKNLMKLIGLAVLTITMAFTYVEKKIVVIDVSHGGQDNGVVVNEVNEKQIALSIANKIKKLNHNSNIEIILTRDSDKFINLNDRAKLINELKPDFAISLHVNAAENEKKVEKKYLLAIKTCKKKSRAI
jgi:N-acetylmuramoyl-L-alanine amidase